jgi:SagB-type dehydrogenase family enzyme
VNKKSKVWVTLILTFVIYCSNAFAEEKGNGGRFILPKPNLSANMTLQKALQNRHTSEFLDKRLPEQVLANLLWAAFGINRKDGKRTAPSAKNTQDITIYAAMKSGVYKYVPNSNQLTLVLKEDIRGKVGYQSFLKSAPVVLIYVSDFTKFGKMSDSEKTFYSAADTAFIGQNVYLYCAGDNLATVIVGWVKRNDIAKILKLNASEKVTLLQPVGYPK